MIRSYYKDGMNTGASAIIEHFPALDVDLAIVSSTQDGAWVSRSEITRRLLADVE